MAVVHALFQKESVSAEPLVGRDEECARLERALDELSQGAACLVGIGGEPGIGKTRLLAQLAGSARRRGFALLAGRTAVPSCDRPAGAALGALGEAIDDHLRSVAPWRLAELGREHRERLAALFPSFPAPVPARGDALARERSALETFLSVRALLEAVASAGPIVITLDDVHWADEDTTAVLALLLARPPEAPVLLAVAYRPRQAPVALRSAFDEAQALTRLALGPLSQAHCAVLAGTPHGSASAVALHRESGGNPLYLKALSSCTETPRADRVEPGAVPLSVETKFAIELGALSVPARAVSSAAAIFAEPVEPGLLAEVAEVPHSALYPALGEAVRQDLLRPIAGTGSFAFRHAVARAAIYQATDSGWRLAAHARAARALQSRRAPVAARVPHLVRLAGPGDVEAMAALVDTASTIWERSATAAQWLRAALQLLPAGADPAPGVLLLELGLALGAEERLGTEGGEGGRQALEQALAELATGRKATETGEQDAAPNAPERTDREVRYLTGRTPWAARRGGEPATLTRRESQVAALVCEGLTNRQIASRLYVADKTVEMHLSKVFAKLNVANRVGVVRAFQRVGEAA